MVETHCKICGGMVSFDDWFNLRCMNCDSIITEEPSYYKMKLSNMFKGKLMGNQE